MYIINVIAGGESFPDRLVYLTASAGDKRKKIESNLKGSGMNMLDRMVISFSEEDKKDVIYPHNDALVVTPIIGDHGIRRTLVDNGSAVNLFSLEAYDLLKRPALELKPCDKPIIGVNGIPIPVKGTTLMSVFFKKDSSKR